MIGWRLAILLLVLSSCGPVEELPPSAEIETPQCHVYRTSNPGPLSDDWQIRGCDDDADCVGYADEDTDRRCFHHNELSGGCCGPVACSTAEDPLCKEDGRCVDPVQGEPICYDAGRECCLCLFRQECLFDDTLGPPRNDFAAVDLCAAESSSLPDMPSLFVGYDCREAGACNDCWEP